MGLVADVTEVNETLAKDVLEVVSHEAVLDADTEIDYAELAERVLATELTASKEDLLTDTIRLIASQEGVKRVMIIPDEQHLDNVREALRKTDDDAKRITVFAMQPFAGGNFRQEILGYSLMQALGIRSDEIK
jgi:hypothetical protein